MNNYLLESRGITKVYGTLVKFKALKGIDLAFKKGEFASLIGYSGSGKTTLLNILGALDQPTEGKLFFGGKDVTEMKEDELALFRNQNLGFIFQFHLLLPEFSVLENVLIPTWIKDKKSGFRKKDRAEDLLDLVGLKEQINKKAGELSGGQQQRVAIARSLINEPAMILADEPTGNLDSETTEIVYSLMRDIHKELKTGFLIVTHNDHIAAKSDRIIEMKDGFITRDYLSSEKSESELWESVAPPYCKMCGKKDSELL